MGVINDFLETIAGNPYRSNNQNGLKDVADSFITQAGNLVTGQHNTPGWSQQAGIDQMNAVADATPTPQQIAQIKDSVKGANDIKPITSVSAEDAAGRASTIGMLDSELDAIAKSIANLDTTWSAGKTQLQDAANKSLSRANEQQSDALSKYATQRADTKQAFNTSLADVDNQAYDNYAALNALLGRAGAGSSSAAQNVVPYAVSQTASKARGGVADTYGKNIRDLNTAEDETKQSYNNIVQDIKDQQNKSLGDLESDIQTKRSGYENDRANLLAQKAQAQGGNWQTVKAAMQPAIDQRDAIDQALAGLLNKYRNPYTVQDVTVTDPNTSNYAVDTNGVKTSDTSGTGTDTDTSADYLAQLKDEEKRKKEQQGIAA